MKFIAKLFMFFVLGVFFLAVLFPCLIPIACGSTLIKWAKSDDDPFMEVAKEEFGSVFECFNPIRIVFKKD